MSVLIFDLRGSIAHFRRPDTLGTHASYPFITRTALHGLVASILGLELLPEAPRCGIRLMTPVRTVAHEMSMLGKGWAGSGSDFNRPTSIELIVQPHYRVYYQGPLQDELTERIKTARSHYHTYLGSAYCLTFPVFVSAYSDNEIQSPKLSGDDALTCVSVVPGKAISRLLPFERDEYARVGGVLYEHIGGRRFRGTLNLIYEVSGRPISFVPSPEGETDLWQFLRIPGEGVVCLW